MRRLGCVNLRRRSQSVLHLGRRGRCLDTLGLRSRSRRARDVGRRMWRLRMRHLLYRTRWCRRLTLDRCDAVLDRLGRLGRMLDLRRRRGVIVGMLPAAQRKQFAPGMLGIQSLDDRLGSIALRQDIIWG